MPPHVVVVGCRPTNPMGGPTAAIPLQVQVLARASPSFCGPFAVKVMRGTTYLGGGGGGGGVCVCGGHSTGGTIHASATLKGYQPSVVEQQPAYAYCLHAWFMQHNTVGTNHMWKQQQPSPRHIRRLEGGGVLTSVQGGAGLVPSLTCQSVQWACLAAAKGRMGLGSTLWYPPRLAPPPSLGSPPKYACLKMLFCMLFVISHARHWLDPHV
jgi:hypothetical protein